MRGIDLFLRHVTRSYSGNKVFLCTRQSVWESQYSFYSRIDSKSITSIISLLISLFQSPQSAAGRTRRSVPGGLGVAVALAGEPEQ